MFKALLGTTVAMTVLAAGPFVSISTELQRQ
jgi:hypothetical protein